MCEYSYIYHSTCQHGSLTRLSYCDKAKALGLPRLNGHSPTGDSADNTSGDLPGPPSSQQPSSSANNISSSHSHSLQQHSHNMSTLTHAGARASFAGNTTSSQREEQPAPHAALIPRSALQEETDISDVLVTHASSMLDVQGFRRVNIDIPLGPQSSMSMEVTHDGKVTELVARFESYAGNRHSDASQESYNDAPHASGLSTHGDSVSDAGTVCGPPSPRKPIPAQWLPANTGPNLATAQRARMRVNKKGSLSGSPVEMKSLRSTRSSFDMNKAYGADGTTFLTKDALSTVESDITSPTTVRSPTKHQRTSSKPAWHSPGASPLHESPRHQPTLTLRSSPAKKALFSQDTGSTAHGGPSSVTTSTRESVFHSAEGSPVRSTADSEQSFQSSAEVLHHHDIYIPPLQLNADNENEQAVQKSGNIQVYTKAATIGRGRSSRPNLTIDTSSDTLRVPPGDDTSASASPPTNGSVASNSPWSAASASSSSRIPRVATSGAASSARGPTRSSTLKRAQSTKSLTSPNAKLQHTNNPRSENTPQPNTSSAASSRHVRTVDSSGRTPILTRRPTDERVTSLSTISTDIAADTPSAKDTQDTLAHVTSTLHKLNVDLQDRLASNDNESVAEQSMRSSSMGTAKAASAVTDPAMLDSAIIYSKMSSASGTISDWPAHSPPIVVIMAHNLDAGSFRVNSDATSAVLSRTVDGTDACSVVPRRTGSTHSLQSSGASDLRATAPEFIPCGASKTSAVTKAVIPTPSADPTTDLLGDQKFELDMYGIPWFYYMYQVQFAYNQGFHYGRSRSPKKFGRKKHRSSLTPPIATESMQYASGPAADSISGRDMPPPVSTISLAEQRAQQKHHNSTREVSPHDGASAGDQMFPAFTAQQDVIARETRLVDTTNMPRGPAVDLSTCRNVPPFAGTRNTAPQADYYNTMPARGYHNSRHHFNRSDNGLYSYGGRGTTGVPMHDTAPFPNPIPPQGRPNGGFNDNPRSNATHVPDYRNYVGSEACGAVDVVFAAERVGGEACNVCEPDHPLD